MLLLRSVVLDVLDMPATCATLFVSGSNQLCCIQNWLLAAKAVECVKEGQRPGSYQLPSVLCPAGDTWRLQHVQRAMQLNPHYAQGHDCAMYTSLAVSPVCRIFADAFTACSLVNSRCCSRLVVQFVLEVKLPQVKSSQKAW